MLQNGATISLSWNGIAALQNPSPNQIGLIRLSHCAFFLAYQGSVCSGDASTFSNQFLNLKTPVYTCYRVYGCLITVQSVSYQCVASLGNVDSLDCPSKALYIFSSSLPMTAWGSSLSLACMCE